MDAVVSCYLEMIGGGVKPPLVTDEEIVCGRISLRVFPAVEAAAALRLVMEFPRDLTPDEAGYPMALKACLAGYEELLPLLARLKAALREKGSHEEELGRWRLRFGRTTIEAIRLSSD